MIVTDCNHLHASACVDDAGIMINDVGSLNQWYVSSFGGTYQGELYLISMIDGRVSVLELPFRCRIMSSCLHDCIIKDPDVFA